MPQPNTVIPTEPLTEREIEILHALAAGASNAEIGGKLHLTEGTVKWYNRRIFDKLGAKNRAEAVRMFGALAAKVSTKAEAHAQPSPPPQPAKPGPNLPEVAMIGREQELADLCELVRTRHLVTLLGPGGIGKSTLAVAAAHALQAAFQDGVWHVTLAGLNHPDEINPAIAASIGLSSSGNSVPVEHLLFYLSDKHALLILDNFDTLVEGAAHIQRILTAAPQVHIVVTSREKLNLSDETLMRLSGLSLISLPYETNSAAIALFLQHAQRNQPKLQPDAPTVSVIAKICQAVEGLPLAIILAASWVDTLSLSDIAVEVTRNLDILSSEMRDVPARHRSMRHVLDQTWERLSLDEQRAYAALAVFRGGFDRAAAQAVANATLRTLNGLMAKSLIQREGERYTAHELLRQYAEQHLSAPDKTAAISAHAQHYLGMLANGEQPEQKAMLDQYFDNVRVAWQYASLAQPALLDPAQLLRYCERLGRFADAASLCSMALTHAPPDGLKAHLFFVRGSARSVMGELDLAIEDFGKALTIVKQTQSTGLSEIVLMTRLGEAMRRASRVQEAREVLTAALDMARQCADAHSEAGILFNLGWCLHYDFDGEKAANYFEQSYRVAQTHGLTGLIAVESSIGLAMAHVNHGNFHDAKHYYLIAHDLAITQGAVHYACECLEMAGSCDFATGEFVDARDLLARSIAMAAQGNMFWMLAFNYAYYGYIITCLGDYAEGHVHMIKGLNMSRSMKLYRFELFGMSCQIRMHLDLGQTYIAMKIANTGLQQFETSLEIAYNNFITIWRTIPNIRSRDLTETDLEKIFVSLINITISWKYEELDLLNAICEVAMRRSDYENVRRYANQLSDIGILHQNRLAAAYALQWQGLLLGAEGENAAGINALKQALAIASDIGYVARQITLHRALQRAYLALSDESNAHQYERAAMTLIAQIADNLRDYPELRSGLHTL